MKAPSLRLPLIGLQLAAVAAFTCPGTQAHAQASNPNLLPSNSAYIISVPDVPAFWQAWKGNAVYAAYKKVMADPDVSSKMANFNKELATIESALGYKLDAETMSQIFKTSDLYVAPGATAGTYVFGAALNVSDKEKLAKLVDLAEKAAIKAVEETDSSSDDEPEDGGKEASKDAEGGKDAPAKGSKPGKAKKSADKPESDGMGGADDTETTKSGTEESPISKEEYAGVSIKRFSADEDSELYYALAGDTLLVSNERAEIKALVDRNKTTDAATLGGSEDYKKVSAALSSHKGEAYLFGNQKAAMEMQSGGNVNALQELTRQFSPTSFYGASMTIQPKEISSYSYGVLAGDAAGTVVGKNPGDKPLQSVSYIPAETLFAFATSLMDSEILYKFAMDLSGAAGSKNLDDQLKGAEMMLGFSVKNDFIPAVGNEMALALNSVKMSGAMPSVDAGLIFSIRDKAKMDKVLGGLERLATNALATQGAEETEDGKDADDKKAKGKKTDTKSAPAAQGGFKEAKVGESTIKYVDSPSLGGMTPGYAVHGNYLIIGSSKEAMTAAIENSTSGKGLAQGDAMKALAPRISTTANMFQYFNIGAMLQTAEIFIKAIPAAQAMGTYINAMKVFKTAASSSSVKDGAVISEAVLILQ